MYEDIAARWTWISRFTSTGFALTLAEGRSPEALLLSFGVDPGEADMLTLAGAGEEFGAEYPVIRAGDLDDWGFAFEEFGQKGGDETAILALSEGTKVASVFRGGDGTSVFTYAENGQLVCAFDPLMASWRRGVDPDRFADTMRAVGIDPGGSTRSGTDPIVAALTLVTVELGVQIDYASIEGPLLSGEAAPSSD